MSDEGIIAAEAPSSIIAAIKAARVEIIDNLFIDLRVPRWTAKGVPLFVRFSPLSTETMSKVQKRFEKVKDDSKQWQADAEVLLRSAQGIFWREEDGVDRSIDPDEAEGTLAHFDRHLCDLLGWEWTGYAVDVVKYIYVTDLSISATLEEVFEWTRQASEKAEETFAGN
jgi:hypothetical protein